MTDKPAATTLEKSAALVELTSTDEATCRAMLVAYNDDFWDALWHLLAPSIDAKTAWVRELVTASDEERIALCAKIDTYYRAPGFFTFYFDNDLEQRFGPKQLREMVRSKPTNDETQVFRSLLSSKNTQLVIAALGHVQRGVEHINDDWEPTFRKLLQYKDAEVFAKTVGLFEDSALHHFMNGLLPEFLNGLVLKRNSSDRNYAASRLFARLPMLFPASLPLAEELLRSSRNSSVRSFAQAICDRHTGVKDREKEAREEMERAHTISAARSTVFDIPNAAVLHRWAENHNWDDGHEYMKAVIEHPECDFGTALLVYWRNKPLWFTQYVGDEEPCMRPFGLFAIGFEIFTLVPQRLRDGAYPRHTIDYDPSNDFGSDWTTGYPNIEQRTLIPQQLRTRVKGGKVESLT
jgi:Domain of unknown function (DUF4274)